MGFVREISHCNSFGFGFTTLEGKRLELANVKLIIQCRADLGEGPGAGEPPLLWVKKEEMTEGRKAGWASQVKPGPFLSSKSGSATVIDKPDPTTRNLHNGFWSSMIEKRYSVQINP